MHNKILLLDHDNGILNLADDIMYYGYSDLYICSDFRSMPQQVKLIQPDLIIWDCSELDREEAAIYKSIKLSLKLAQIPIIVVSSFENKYLNNDESNPDIVMLKPFTADDLSARIEYLLAS